MAEELPRLPDVTRGQPIEFTFNGERVPAFGGETIAAALAAAGRRTLRTTPRAKAPRGLFCVMGVCFDCVVAVDGRPGVRACMTPARHGSIVTSSS